MRVLTPTLFAIFLVLLCCLTSGAAGAQVNCSPAPCVLPPTQASEGGALVNTSPIVANPLNPERLLLGSNDWNCPAPSTAGFHLSNDGGSTWSVTCMPVVRTKNYVFWPDGDPMVGYDRNGVAYIATSYADSETGSIGFVGVQKSQDGMHWSQPAAVLSVPETVPVEGWLTVDTNVGSPYLNSLYVTAVMIGPPGVQSENQVVVSHSHDGGRTWSRAQAEPIQTYPANEGFTSMAVGKDGTAYLTWQHCVGTGPAAGCKNGRGYMVLSKSSDGGVTWSHPTLMTAIMIAPSPCNCYAGLLPNTNDVRVYNYPAIGVDNSSGPYAGNLYVVMYTWTGTYMQVQVIRSTDGGSTWSKPYGVTFDGANVWVSNWDSGNVSKLRASDGKLLGTFTVGANPGWMTFDGADLWVPYGNNLLAKIRASDGKTLGTFTVGYAPLAAACDGPNIWITNTGDGTVTKLQASSGNTLGTFPVGSRPTGIAFDGASIWVANRNDGTVSKLRASDGTLLGTFNVSTSGPYGIAFDGENIWVTGGTSIVELRASDGTQIGVFRSAAASIGVAFDGANVWVSLLKFNAVGKL